MKIGFDAKRIFHNFRGLGKYSRTLVQGLERNYPGHNYVLFTPEFKDPRAIRWQKENSAFEIKCPSGLINRTFPTLWRSLLLSKDLAKAGLDIYHGLSHELPPGIENLPLKSVVTIHDLIFLRFPEFFPWVDRKVYMAKFSHSCQRADYVLAICEQTKNDLIHMLNVPADKITVMYQACDPIFYKSLDRADIIPILKEYGVGDMFLLFVGALEKRKNPTTVLTAFASLKNYEGELVLIGRGKEKESLLKLASELGVENRIKILESVPDAHLPAFYQAADIFLWPSLFEGFGLPIVEALFSGCPVVTSQGSCFPEAGGDGVIYINPESEEELALSCQKILSEPLFREELINKGRQHVEKFHINNTSRNLMEFYEKIIAR